MVRSILICGLFGGVLLATESASASAQQGNDAYASIAQLQQQMDAEKLSTQTLKQQFAARIERIDHTGPSLRSILEVNPDATSLATALDKHRPKKHGPLYGIPVMLKDNIDTGDRMQTSAGSLALVGAPASRDAALVTRLRDAGALIQGKSNPSEWANYRSNHASSGWSGRGGQTRNPPTRWTVTRVDRRAPARPLP